MPHLTAIILAAGHSRRMDTANKLLLPLGEKTILARVVEAVCAAPIEDVVVVTGHEAEPVRAALAGYRVRLAHNASYADGMATSIGCGIRAARADTDGYLICLGDMPLVSSATIARLRQAFAGQPPPSIVVASAEGRRGHPVLFHRAYRDALGRLRGDVGARAVLQAHADAVVEVEVDGNEIFQDIDTPEAYERLCASRA